MALFKPFRGNRTALDAQPLHDGYAYFCVDDGTFHIDYVDADGNLQRKQLNAKDAESLSGMSLEEIKTYLAEQDDRIAELEGSITTVTFDITEENAEIEFVRLIGASKVDWGDGTVNNSLKHTYNKTDTYYCKIYGLTDLILGATGPNSATMTGSTYVTAVDIGKTVTKISGLYGTKIATLVLPDTVTQIESYAFYGCDSLNSVIIGNGVTSISWIAFYNCRNLTNLIIKEGVTSIGNEAFSGCRSLTNLAIPNSVTHIGSKAFKNCTALTSVVIGDSATSIGEDAFDGCSSLTEVIFKSTNPISLPKTFFGPEVGYKQNAFTNCPVLSEIYVPYGCIEAYKLAWADLPDVVSLIVESDREAMMSDLSPVAKTGNMRDLIIDWDMMFVFDGGDADVSLAVLDDTILL